MKKGLLIIAIAMLAGFTANAQLSVGAGYQGQNRTTSMSSNTAAFSQPEQSNWFNGFYVGANYNVQLVAGLNIAPGLHFTCNKFSEKETIAGTEFESKEVEMGIKVPVLLNYRFGFNRDRFIIAPYLGLTFGFVISDKETVTGGGIETTIDAYDKDAWDGEHTPSRFDMFTSVGIMFMFNEHYRVNVGYDLSLLNRYSPLHQEVMGVTLDPKMSMGNLNIGVGFEF